MLVEMEGGKLKTVSGDKDNPDSQGFLCRARPQRRCGFALAPLKIHLGRDACAYSLRGLTPRMRVYASLGHHCFWFLACGNYGAPLATCPSNAHQHRQKIACQRGAGMPGLP